MKLFRRLIPLETALKTVLSYADRDGIRAEIEDIGFEAAMNRVLAEDVYSPIDSPPFDRAAMDGYAIRGEDSFGASPGKPVVLKINNSGSASGSGSISSSECIPIATGMPMPEGCNAVVMLEYTKKSGDGDRLEIFRPVTPGKNVSFKGEDVKKGEIVLKAGKILLAHDVGMLASLFKRRVKVYKRAKIGILSTGDELIDPNLALPLPLPVPEHERRNGDIAIPIADANSYLLSALTGKIASPYRMGIVDDDYDKIKDAIRSSLEGAGTETGAGAVSCDGLLVSGGSSVGERDFLADVIEDLANQDQRSEKFDGGLIFHGVAIRPGEPVGFGIVNSKPVFLLPGYPVAAISAFELLVRPFLYRMHGIKYGQRKIFNRAITTKKIASTIGRTDFVRVRVFRTGSKFYAEPIRVSGSGILSSMTKSDGFVVIAENKEGVAEGEQVVVTEYSEL